MRFGMARTIIHVNQHTVKKNGKTGSRDPVLTVKQGRKNTGDAPPAG